MYIGLGSLVLLLRLLHRALGVQVYGLYYYGKGLFLVFSTFRLHVAFFGLVGWGAGRSGSVLRLGVSIVAFLFQGFFLYRRVPLVSYVGGVSPMFYMSFLLPLLGHTGSFLYLFLYG